MMMTSSSGQMLLLSTPPPTPGPGPCPRSPLVTPGLKPWFTPLYSSTDNPPQHTRARTHKYSPRAIISTELCSVSCSLWFSLLLPTAAMAFNWNVCLPLCGPLESHKWPQLICYPHYGWFALQGSAGSPPAVGAEKDFQEGCATFFFIRKLELRTATRIVNSGASPHTLGVM